MTKNITAGCIALSFSLFGMLNPSWAYENQEGRIVDENNSYEEVHIDGVNWSGFQDSGLFVDEMYGAIPFYPVAQQYQQPIKLGVIDMLKNPENFSEQTFPCVKDPIPCVVKSVSFKTIRLPINLLNLDSEASNTHFRRDLTDFNNQRAGNGVFCTWETGSCNPLNVKQSLFQLINELKRNDIRVLVDLHVIEPHKRDGNVINPEKNYTLNFYQSKVAQLAKEIKTRGLDNVIGIDVFNEPHRLFWFSSSDGVQPAWVDVIAAAAKAVYRENPDLLLFVEGPSSEESGTPVCVADGSIPKNPPLPPGCSAGDKSCDKFTAYTSSRDVGVCPVTPHNERIKFKANWGENFRALLDVNAAQNGQAKMGPQLRDELAKQLTSAELNWLLGNPNQNNNGAHIVFSPHVYGAHVAEWQSTKEVSPHRFNWHFGFLRDANYPVVIGESGYFVDKADDVAFFRDSVTPYLIDKNMNHNLFYWTFNTNSGDTGGVRVDQGNAQLNLQKSQALHNLFYAKPIQ